jgi:hypothetical protein
MRSAPPPHRPDYVAGYVFTHASRIPSPPLTHPCPIGNTSRTKPSHSRYQPDAAAVPTGRDSPDVSRGNTNSHIATTRHAPQDRSSVTAPMRAQTDERSAIAQHVPGPCVLWHAPQASRLPQAIQHTIALPATTRNSAFVCSFGCYDAHNRRQKPGSLRRRATSRCGFGRACAVVHHQPRASQPPGLSRSRLPSGRCSYAV